MLLPAGRLFFLGIMTVLSILRLEVKELLRSTDLQWHCALNIGLVTFGFKEVNIYRKFVRNIDEPPISTGHELACNYFKIF